jgi:hypothetical protein
MSVAHTLVLTDVRASTADRVTRGIAVALATYFSIVLWPLWRDAGSTGTLTPLFTHLAMLAYVLLLLGMRGAAWRPALDWLVLTVGPLMYIEMRWIIAGMGLPHHDATIVGWEHALFPSNPSATLAPALHLPLLSEVLHFAYASYYLIIYLPPIALYVMGKRDAFVKTVLALTIVYGACFIIYALFPVDGPRYLVGPAAAPDGPVLRARAPRARLVARDRVPLLTRRGVARLGAVRAALPARRRPGRRACRRGARGRDGLRRVPLRRGRARRRDPRQPRLARFRHSLERGRIARGADGNGGLIPDPGARERLG